MFQLSSVVVYTTIEFSEIIVRKGQSAWKVLLCHTQRSNTIPVIPSLKIDKVILDKNMLRRQLTQLFRVDIRQNSQCEIPLKIK